MSQENVELVYRAHDAFNRRDIDALRALSDPDMEFIPALVELEGPYRGHDALRRWRENVLGAFPDFSGEVEEVRDLGEVTVARVRLRGQGMESDAPTEATLWEVVEWRRSKAIRWRHFRSEAEALEAVGLSE
jgi:ketosteroid isomerase-like protein